MSSLHPVSGRATVRSNVSVRLLAMTLAMVLILVGCRQSFDYYNPLDPNEDAPISAIIDHVQDETIRNAILDSGAQTKRELGYLRVDNLDHSPGYVETLAGIEFLSYTIDLGLYDTDMMLYLIDDDLSPLTKMLALERLELPGNYVGDDDVAMIPYIAGLNFLGLANNEIGDAGSLEPVLRQYQRGRLFLDINANPIEPDTFQSFTPVLDRLNGLDIAFLTGADPLIDLAFLVENDTIRSLDVSRNESLVDISTLDRLSVLESLNASFTAIDDTALANMPVIPDLLYLSLAETSIENVQVIADKISGYAPGQLTLDISENRSSTGLHELDFLGEELDRLNALYIQGGDTALNDIFFLGVGGDNSTVRQLNVSFHTIQDLDPIKHLKALEILWIEHNEGPTDLPGSARLLELSNLQEIWAFNSGIDPAVLDELAARGVYVDY